MRTWNSRTVTKAIGTTATTLEFTGQDILADGVVAIAIGINGVSGGTGQNASKISRIRMLANNTSLFNCSFAELRSLLQWGLPGHNDPGATATSFLLPFFLLGIEDPDLADQCQFPTGANPTLQIDIAAGGTGAGAVCLNYLVTDVPQRLFPTTYSTPMQVQASQPNAEYAFSDGGELRAIGMDFTGIERFRFILNNMMKYSSTGPAFPSCPVNQLAQLLQLEVEAPLLTAPLIVPTPFGQNAAVGQTQLELATSAAWPGIAQPLLIHSIHQPMDLR